MGALKNTFWYILILFILDLIVLYTGSLLVFWVVAFIISLSVLVKSSDLFIDQAEKVGSILGIPHFIVGVTIVAIGTSLPELATSLISISKGAGEFVAGNVVGSNIANILLIIGIASFFAKKVMSAKWNLISVDLPLLFASTLYLTYSMWDGQIIFYEAVLGLVGYAIYAIYSISNRSSDNENNKEKFSISILIILIASSIGIYFGAKYTIESVIAISGMLGFVDTSVIALTAVAIGTSLPELMVSISAVRKNNFDIALGNVLGSNIFNGFVVIGISGLFGTLPVPSNIITVGLSFMVGATFLYIVSTIDKEITKYEGAMFLLIYILFIIQLVGG